MKKTILAVVLLLTAEAVLPPAHAQESSVPAMLQQRHQDMNANGKAMNRLGRIFKGAAPYERTAVAEGAGMIVEHSGEETAGLSPDGSLEVEGSHARLGIALNRERSARPFMEMNTSSREPVSLAQQDVSDRALPAVLALLGKTCSSFRTDFRIKH